MKILKKIETLKMIETMIDDDKEILWDCTFFERS